jgi:hypothetical protein
MAFCLLAGAHAAMHSALRRVLAGPLRTGLMRAHSICTYECPRLRHGRGRSYAWAPENVHVPRQPGRKTYTVADAQRTHGARVHSKRSAHCSHRMAYHLPCEFVQVDGFHWLHTVMRAAITHGCPQSCHSFFSGLQVRPCGKHACMHTSPRI